MSEKNTIEKHLEVANANGPENDEEEGMSEDPPVEYHHERNNSLPELFGDEAHQNDWEKYWAKNGERLIWQTWIEKYIDYINPEYLDKNNMQFYETTTSADTNKLEDTGSSEQVFTFDAKDIGKFNNNDNCDNVPDSSMEIVISPPAKQTTEDLIIQGWNKLSPDSISKQEDYHNYSHSRHYQHHHHRHNNHQHHNVSFHEIDNLLSPRCESINSSIPLTLGTFTDSMTNVTRMTCSSYGFGSSHVTSESTPTSSEEEEESNTISSFSDSEESDNQMTTRVANECERLLMEHKTEHEHIPPASEDKDSEEYWQMKWQQHVQEMYVKHYNEFMEAHRIISDEMSSSFKSDSGFLPGENAGCCGKFSNKRRRKKHSLQRLVANLNLRSDLAKYSTKQPEKEAPPTDGDEKHCCHHDPSHSDSTVIDTTEASLMESLGLPTSFGSKPGKSIKIGGNGDDEEPPEDRPINLKRSHEIDADEMNSDHIKSQFELMGYIFNDNINDNQVINGEVVYRKKHVRLHTRMLKMFPNNNAIKPKHTYFDDDGNEINNESNNQSGADTLHASSSDEEMPIPATRLSSSIVPQFTTQLSSDGNANEDEQNEQQNKEEIVNINLSIDQDYDSNCIDEAATLNESQSLSKKEKKKKRKGKFQMSIPLEIANDKVLKKYWYKRFSLFHLFDFGIRLDRGKFLTYF